MKDRYRRTIDRSMVTQPCYVKVHIDTSVVLTRHRIDKAIFLVSHRGLTSSVQPS